MKKLEKLSLRDCSNLELNSVETRSYQGGTASPNTWYGCPSGTITIIGNKRKVDPTTDLCPDPTE